MIDLHFTRTNGAADKSIDELIDLVGNISHPQFVREIILAALKAGQEQNDRAHMKLMNTTMKEMRFTGKMFAPYSHIRKVTVFGSARTGREEPIYKIAHDFSRALADTGYMIITGGGPGIMQAANEGAGPEHSFGVNIQLPFEQKPNAIVIDNPRLITYKYFFNRKVAFLKEADAVALFPGGFGTLDEAMETLTLLQTGKHDPLPLILLDEPGGTYWSRWLKFLNEELMLPDYIDDYDLNLFECVDSIDKAVDIINNFYSRYHSIRYVKGKLVIRINSGIDPLSLKMLNEKFRNILEEDGKIYVSGPLPEEYDEPDLIDKPRLVVDFNNRDFGRLRGLIDEINGLDNTN